MHINPVVIKNEKCLPLQLSTYSCRYGDMPFAFNETLIGHLKLEKV